MCRYDYSAYDACSHSVIECRNPCTKCLWRAGMTGCLVRCVPDILSSSIEWLGPKEDEPPHITLFTVQSGYCDPCIKQLKIQDNLREITSTTNYFVDSHQHNPLHNAPYFQVEELLTTIPHLLAVDHQLIKANMDLGPTVLFPGSLEKLTWAALRQRLPYKVLGLWNTNEGTRSINQILNSLRCHSGTGPEDRNMIVHVLKNNLNIDGFYEDIFKERGMPYSMFSRFCAHIKENAIHPSFAPHLNNSSKDGSPRSARNNSIRSGDENAAVDLSPMLLPHAQPAPGIQLGQGSAPQALSDVNRSDLDASLHDQEQSSQASQGPHGTKRSLSSTQEECAQSTWSDFKPQRSQQDRETNEHTAKRLRYSQPVEASRLGPDAPNVQTNAVASSSQLSLSTVGRPGVASNDSPQAPPPAQAASNSQQPGLQGQVGQFDIAASRDMQAQERASQAVPLPPPSAQVIQDQDAMLQAARAQVAQLQACQVQAQVVNALLAQSLQAQSRQSQALSEIAARQFQDPYFRKFYLKHLENNGFSPAHARATMMEPMVNGTSANSLPPAQFPIQQPLMTQSTDTQSLLHHASADHNSIAQTPMGEPAVSHSAIRQSMAGPSSAPQQPSQANTEDIPGKGKGVLPHAITKATFFLNEQEKRAAYSHLTVAWTTYRSYSEESAAKQGAASWIVNFSLNFRQQWTMSARSGETLRHTTFAQLTQCRSGVRTQDLIPAPSAAH